MTGDADVYQELADMVDDEAVVGAANTPALLKLLSLYLTPAASA